MRDCWSWIKDTLASHQSMWIVIFSRTTNWASATVRHVNKFLIVGSLIAISCVYSSHCVYSSLRLLIAELQAARSDQRILLERLINLTRENTAQNRNLAPNLPFPPSYHAYQAPPAYQESLHHSTCRPATTSPYIVAPESNNNTTRNRFRCRGPPIGLDITPRTALNIIETGVALNVIGTGTLQRGQE